MVNLPAIGKSLRRLRLTRGLTLAQVSNLTSVSPVTVHNIEKGLYEPKISTLIDLCSALNVPIDQFIRPKINDIFIKIPSESDESNPRSGARRKQAPSKLPQINRIELIAKRETIIKEFSGLSISLHLVFGRVGIRCGANSAELLPGDTLHLETYQEVVILPLINSLLIQFTEN